MLLMKEGQDITRVHASVTRIGSARLSSPSVPALPPSLGGGASTPATHGAHPRVQRASSLLRMGLRSPPPEGKSQQAHADAVHELLAKGIMLRLLKHVKEQHDHGIVHLDIKMDNICIDESWGVRLLDYGQSRPTSDQALATCGRVAENGVPKRYPQPPRVEVRVVSMLLCVRLLLIVLGLYLPLTIACPIHCTTRVGATHAALFAKA